MLQRRKRDNFLIPILILVMFVHGCNPKGANGTDKDKNEFFLIGILASNPPETPKAREGNLKPIPEIPEIVLPAEIASLSPKNASTYFLDWADLGLKSFDNSCGVNGYNGNVQIQRILPTTRLILEVKFTQNVNAGNIQVFRKGIQVPGNFTMSDAKTARFESDDPGDFASFFTYSATASNFARASDGTEILPVTWQFHTNFSGTKGSASSITENCNMINGKNRCTVTAVQQMSDELQDVFKQDILDYFYSDLSYYEIYNNNLHSYGYFVMECPGPSVISAKAQEKEFWSLEMNATFPNIPMTAQSGNYRVDSITTGYALDPNDDNFFQFTVFK
ncbi:hypothetical protein [Leptospira stimsonii]|uniref:Uncharacterized protein n=1 Tax=Leptospira stimsonii TaxID=2202203 RepID=A0A8B6RYK7_9LEPT|nr:hypothetical protein [Leptospira stimsonii]RHX86375.1 hypothetical protein DLM78_11120 [Leptospira stimsonii]